MSDKPILFNVPMVRAILREIEKPGSGKTQTRRKYDMRYSVGDRLWVREPWRGEAVYDDTPPRDIPHDACQVLYESDGKLSGRDAMTRAGKLRPAMFMPRWASRLTLTVTAVKVERLQDISEEDAVAEGVGTDVWSSVVPFLANLEDADLRAVDTPVFWAPDDDADDSVRMTAKDAFSRLWNSIHGPDAWEANPWVVAYTFTPALGNIDAEPRP